MKAFKVHLNGRKLCVAGVGGDGVLTAIVDYVARQDSANISLHVGGLHSLTDEHLRWVERRPLRIGDKIQVEIVDAASVDVPKKKYRTHPAETLRAQKRYVRQMARKLGWKIVTAKSSPG